MSSLFPARSSGDSWFRLGRLEVGTVTLVTLVTVVSWIAWAIAPGIGQLLAFSPSAVVAGRVWGIFTWPLAGTASLFAVINLFFFWYFGNDIEAQIGRRRMASFLVGMWGALTLAYTLAALVTGDPIGLAGIGLVQFLLLMVWIADNPRRPFFFGIPAWVIGAVLVGLQVLTLTAMRAWASLLALVLAFVFVAIMARRTGLLQDFSWIPGQRNQRRQRRPAPVRQPDAPSAREQRQRISDAERLDELLDKIGSEGIHSLTLAERKELDKLRERRRQGR